MIVWPGLRRSMGTRAGIPIANRAAHFDASLGITSSGGFASAWADQSGNGRSLLQATGANQPIHLAYSGAKYGWLPGVAGNYFSTPDSVANSITSDIDIRVRVALADWTPAAASYLVSKRNAATGVAEAYGFAVNPGGDLLFTHNNGGTQTIASSIAATGISDGAESWVRVTWAQSTGFINFYKSSDGSSWSQVGAADIAGPTTAINDGTRALAVGSDPDTTFSSAGKVYRAQIYNGINGTLAVDFDPSRWTSGTTFTASTGETWTINSTGSKPAQIVDRSSLLFDGAAHYMKTAPFTLNQPETVYWVGRQVTWALNDYLYDGATANRMVLYHATSTPTLGIFAGTVTAPNADLAVGAIGVDCAVFNGAGSSHQINAGSVVTGNAGTGNADGITLGANPVPSLYSNVQVYETLVYNVAHDAAARANIIRALMSKHGVA